MFAVEVCSLPESGGSTGMVIAGLLSLVLGATVVRWVRQSAHRLSVVVAPPCVVGRIGPDFEPYRAPKPM